MKDYLTEGHEGKEENKKGREKGVLGIDRRLAPVVVLDLPLGDIYRRSLEHDRARHTKKR